MKPKPEDGKPWALTSRDEVAAEAVAPVLGRGRSARWRLLDVRCPDGRHRLAQVFTTTIGPVLVGTGPLVHGWGIEATEEFRPALEVETGQRHRGEVVVQSVEQLRTLRRDGVWHEPAVLLQERCGRYRVTLDWLERHLEQSTQVACVVKGTLH